MNRNVLFALAGGLVAGGLAGYFIGTAHAPDSSMVMAAPVAAAATTAPAMPGTSPMATPPNPAELQRITELEGTLLREPKNRSAWVELGNGYFDTHQPQKAVTAYAKALALQGDDPNVLTDQGVMYRQLGEFDKAVANFKKAQKVDPKHIQSLFNLGIVYANDLHKTAEATAAWNKLIALAPDSPQATQARQALAQIKGPEIR